jgi:protein QN1
MEERFERYLGSDDDGAAGAFSAGAGAARYGGEALGARGRAGAGSRVSAGSEYDFDIDFSKPAGEGNKGVSKQERKLAKEREKAAEADRRAQRASALTKSKEERMAELLGQLSSERQAEKAAAEAARRREEEQAERQAEAAELRRREREADEAAATAIADDLDEHELDEPLASDSLEMSDADFEVGGYQKKRAAAAVSAPAAMSGASSAAAAAAAAEADAAYSDQEEEEEEEDQLAALKRRLSTQLTSGLKPEEVGQAFSMGDLASLLKHQSASPSYESPRTGTGTDDGSARGYHDDRSGALLDAGEESEHLREASEIYASFEADRESEAHSSPSPLVSSAARQGARIRARLFDWTQHYSGRVEMVRPDGRLDLHFDDGDRIGGVSPAKVIFDAFADDEDEDYHRLDAGRDEGHVRPGGKAQAEDDGGLDAELRARLQEDQLLDARSPALAGGTPPSSPPRRPRPQSLSSDGSNAPHRPDSPNSRGSNRSPRSPRSPKQDAASSSPLRRPESPSSRGSPRSPKKQEQQEQEQEQQQVAPREPRPAPRNQQQLQQKEQQEPNAADRIKELFWGGMADAARTPPNSPPRRGAGTSPPPPPPSTIRGRAQQPKPRHGAGKHEPQAAHTYGLSKAGQPRVIQLSNKRSSPQQKEHAQPQQQDKRVLAQMLAHEEAALARLQEQRRGRRSGEDAQLLASIDGGLSVSGEVARLRLLCGSLEAEAEEARRKLETAAEREKRAARHAESQAAEIFRLSARVRELEAASAVRLALRTVLRSSPEASVPREQLEAIEREMQQQERLLQGFQKENEKLVGQLRDAQRLADEVRDQMFAASARLGLGDHHSAAGAALSASQATEDGVPPPPPPPTDRGAKAAAAQDLRSRLDADKALRAAQQQLLDLRVDHAARVATLKAELDAARAATQVAAAPGSTAAAAAPRDAQDAVAALRRELAEARAEHQGEAKALRSKLAWYVENQELLSANDQTIQTLRARVRELESGGDGAAGSGADNHEEHRHAHDAKENGHRTPNAKASPPGGGGRPRASLPGDLKRIRELERTVKELEEALRKRHPDSVAQLILAAGPGEAEKETRRELRAEINSLREELQAREHSFNARLRGLRQEHERVKAAHDKQLAEARAVAAAQAWVGGAGPNAAALDEEHPHHTGMAAGHDGRVVALEAELARVRDFYRKKLEALSKKQSVALRAARRDGGSVISTPEGSAQRDADRLRAAKLALEARVEELEDALAQAGLPGMQPRHKQQEHQQQSAQSPKQQQQQLKRAVDTPGDEDQHENKGASPTQRKSAAAEGSPKGSEDDPAALLLRMQLLENENRVLTRRLEAITAGGPAVVAAVAAAAPDLAASVSANPFSAAGVAADSHGAPAASAMTAHYERALARSEAAVKRLFAANCELEARLEETARALPAAPSLLQQQQLARRLAEVEGRLLARERELELVVQQVRQRAEADRRTQEAAHGAAMAAKNVELTRYRLELDALLESIKLLQQ